MNDEQWMIWRWHSIFDDNDERVSVWIFATREEATAYHATLRQLTGDYYAGPGPTYNWPRHIDRARADGTLTDMTKEEV